MSVCSDRVGQIQKNDVGRVADGNVVSGEIQLAVLLVNLKDGQMVGTLIAAVKKTTCGVKAETARVIASSPFVINMSELAV